MYTDSLYLGQICTLLLCIVCCATSCLLSYFFVKPSFLVAKVQRYLPEDPTRYMDMTGSQTNTYIYIFL